MSSKIFDIESVKLSVPEEIVKKRIKHMKFKAGNETEKELITNGKINEITNQKLLDEYYKKLPLIAGGNPLDPRFAKMIAFNFYNGQEHLGFVDDNEEKLLKELKNILIGQNTIYMSDIRTFNGWKFDFPFLIWRARINRMFDFAQFLESYKQSIDMFRIINNPYANSSDRFDYTKPGHWISQDDACVLLDIPGAIPLKGDGIAELYQKFKEGNKDKDWLELILHKCQSDTIRLYNICERLGY